MKPVIVHDTKTSAMAFGYDIKSMYNFHGILVEEFHARVIILQTLQWGMSLWRPLLELLNWYTLI